MKEKHQNSIEQKQKEHQRKLEDQEKAKT